MKMHKELRSHPRFAVMWRVLYGNQKVFGQGSVFNISDGGCQVTTLMPVATGTRLKLWIFTPDRQDPLYVGDARVCWAEGHRFGLELGRLHVTDSLAHKVLRKCPQEQCPEAPNTEDVAAMRLPVSMKVWCTNKGRQ